MGFEEIVVKASNGSMVYVAKLMRFILRCFQGGSRVVVCVRRSIIVFVAVLLILSLQAMTSPAFAAQKSSTVEGVHVTKVSKKSISIAWKSSKNDSAFVVYRSADGKSYKRCATVTAKNRFTDKKVKAKRTYYYKVAAKSNLNNPSIWVSAKAGYAKRQVKSIKVSKAKLRLAVKSSNYKINVKLKKWKGQKLLSKKVRFESSNAKVAVVSKNGAVAPVGRGTCYVKCIAHNGKYAKVKVQVVDRGIPIFAYHDIVSDEEKVSVKAYRDSDIVMSVSEFERQMAWLKKNNYKTLSCQEFDRWYSGKTAVPDKMVLLTFDDGLYGTIKNATPILKKYNLKGVYFIIGNAAINKAGESQKRYASVEEIKDAQAVYGGIDCESHSWGFHSNRNLVANKTYEECVSDCKLQASYFGYKYLAYPYGCDPVQYRKAAKDTGIKMAFDYGKKELAFKSDNRYSISRIKVPAGAPISEFQKWAKTSYR